MKTIRAVHFETGEEYERRWALTEEDLENKIAYLSEAYPECLVEVLED